MRNAAISLLSLLVSLSALAAGRDVTFGTRAQCCPSVSADGVDFMTVFGELGLAAARVSRAGVPLDSGGLEVAPIGGEPSIAFGSSTYLIAWIESTLYTRRYAMDGTAIDPAPVPIHKVGEVSPYYSSRRIAVAANGNAFLVVWIEDSQLFGATIAVDGTVSAAKPIIRVAYYDAEPDVAWNGQEFLVIWSYFTASPIEGPPIRAATLATRVARDGAPLDGFPTFIDTPALRTRRATVASNGRDFLVALDGYRDLTLVPITTSSGMLTVGPPKTLFRWFGGIQSDITSDANGYAISWRYPVSGPFYGPDGKLLAIQWLLAVAHLSAGGDLYSGVSTSISAATFDLTYDFARPSTATNQFGNTAVVIREQLPGSVPRVRAYFDWEMTPMPPPPSPPRNVVATGTPDNLVVSWEPTSNDATAFAVEAPSFGETFDSMSVVPGDQRSVSIRFSTAKVVRVRAFNAGGMSEPSELVTVRPAPRRRAIGSR